MLNLAMKKKITIATDLDGTFLETENKSNDPLYKMIFKYQNQINLIYVTGRGLQSVKPLLSDPELPKPDYIIADVGATFYDVKKGSIIETLQKKIDITWPGSDYFENLLASVKNLKKQDVPQERRCSYIFNDKTDFNHISKILSTENCSTLFSANQYFDILPKNVNKGASLLNLLQFFNIETENTLVAGDTLNDLSLFQTGLKGVVVGLAEDALVEKVHQYSQTFVSREKGTLGIVEALERFGFVFETEESKNGLDSAQYGQSELVMVYHRQPFDEVKKGKTVERSLPKSPNGIIPTLLNFFSHDKEGSWVAWSQQASRTPDNFDIHVDVNKELYPKLKCARIPLTTEDVSLFYKKFSKESFWPIIFSFPSKFEVNHKSWLHFKEINQAFANQAAREAKKEAIVWIHDYNLWLVPGYLRKLRPDVKISFFHHTAFPSADIFNLLPWKKEIIESLIQCDHVGFHIPRYVENFVDVLKSNYPIQIQKIKSSAPRYLTYGCALGVDHFTTDVRIGSKDLILGAHPVGIDTKKIFEIYQHSNTQVQIQKLKSELINRKVILSVERLDYVKGPIEKILAFEEFLEKNPDFHEKVVFINIVTPPAPGMEVYKTTREKLDQIIGRVNGRFARVNWTPIRYFYRSFPFEEIIPFYSVSDIAWITPLRDGLNLVCKEFVATKSVTQKAGVLILSEFAGAAVELHGAILVNPFDQHQMVESLKQAIQMNVVEMNQRQRQLSATVETYNIKRWADDYMQTLNEL